MNPAPVSKTIKLNQTNYGLVIKEVDNNESAAPYILHTIKEYPSSKTIYLQGNTSWSLSTSTTNDVPLSNVISNALPLSGGADLSDGTYNSDPITLTSSAGVTGTNGSKGQYASLVFSDPTNKAYDVEIDVMQCLGSLYTVGSNVVDASPTETSQAGNSWGNAVVRHAEKAGKYEGFYSSYFGTAGRWMITNLAAYDYDELPGDPPAPDVADEMSLTAPYMVFPQPIQAFDLTDPDYFNEFPEYGYLYNYPAASGNNNSEGPQGICPKGWHLPTEADWLGLQSAITADPTKYALSPTTSAGSAMMNACETFSGTLGLSKPLPEGGFNVFLIGYATDLSTGLDMEEIGEASVFWSSTVASIGMGTYVFANSAGTVTALGYGQDSFMSVRCKKTGT